jgi:hypothetical protein
MCVCVSEGSASLLRWWFRGKNTTLIKDKSLRIDFTTNDTLGSLQINIEGNRNYDVSFNHLSRGSSLEVAAAGFCRAI